MQILCNLGQTSYIMIVGIPHMRIIYEKFLPMKT